MILYSIYFVFIQGYKSKNAYVLTQMPLPHTVIDLWRMVHEHKCGSIVMLNPWDETDPVRKHFITTCKCIRY